jgi:hypothetical protein
MQKSRRDALKFIGRAAAAAPIVAVAVVPAAAEERLVLITGLEWVSMRDELQNCFELMQPGPLNMDAAYFRWVGHGDAG